MPILIISGPSGAGKTSVATKICEKTKWKRSVSYTTRDPRSNEIHGEDYHFVDKKTFEKLKTERFFLETAKVLGNYYGTPLADSDKHVIFVIDPQGAKEVAKHYPKALKVFISPPSKSHALERLKLRGQDTNSVIVDRMKDFEDTMKEQSHYDHVLINQDLDQTVENLYDLLKKYELPDQDIPQRHKSSS